MKITKIRIGLLVVLFLLIIWVLPCKSSLLDIKQACMLEGNKFSNKVLDIQYEIPDGWTNSINTFEINNQTIQLVHLVNEAQTAEIEVRVIDAASAMTDRYGYRRTNASIRFLDLSSYLKNRVKLFKNGYMEMDSDNMGPIDVEIGEVKAVKLEKKKGKKIIMRTEIEVPNAESYALFPQEMKGMIKESTNSDGEIVKLTFENTKTIYVFKEKGNLLYIETNAVNKEGEEQVEEALSKLK